jgi:hypothetical protein
MIQTMRFAALMIAALSAIVPAVHAQPSAGSNRVLSPTTVAYWQQHDNGDGTGSLDLLVLWRGSPGWFFRSGGTSGGGVHMAASGSGRRLIG